MAEQRHRDYPDLTSFGSWGPDGNRRSSGLGCRLCNGVMRKHNPSPGHECALEARVRRGAIVCRCVWDWARNKTWGTWGTVQGLASLLVPTSSDRALCETVAKQSATGCVCACEKAGVIVCHTSRFDKMSVAV
ncbi:unnamed protein product [Protopolystoma xenopodis]|uniref:Uncharacterized protein n=1 Tax=Protopolystoma xenopodis TaxID=117903 RepID=A0A3S5A797_9PLAT|nr:unnamed protein product [Protopolystoma xenopodis]